MAMNRDMPIFPSFSYNNEALAEATIPRDKYLLAVGKFLHPRKEGFQDRPGPEALHEHPVEQGLVHAEEVLPFLVLETETGLEDLGSIL